MTQQTKKPLSVLSCLACDKTLKSMQPDSKVNHPSGGLIFQASGQFGTTAFDPMDGSLLEINICDECVKKAAKKYQVLFAEAANVTLKRRLKISYWDGKG